MMHHVIAMPLCLVLADAVATRQLRTDPVDQRAYPIRAAAATLVDGGLVLGEWLFCNQLILNDMTLIVSPGRDR